VSGPETSYVLLAGADVERLTQFRAAHPETVIDDGGRAVWRAIIPEPNGETVVVRYTLRELLDKLDELFPDLPQIARHLVPPGVARQETVPAGRRGQRGSLPMGNSPFPRVPRLAGTAKDGPCWGLPGAGVWPIPLIRRAFPRHGPSTGTAVFLRGHFRLRRPVLRERRPAFPRRDRPRIHREPLQVVGVRRLLSPRRALAAVAAGRSAVPGRIRFRQASALSWGVRRAPVPAWIQVRVRIPAPAVGHDTLRRT
jgi:hypothetical protein